MERRDFLKTIGAGVVSMAVCSEITANSAPHEKLPSFGLITGSNGSWHKDGAVEGLKKLAEWGYTELEGGGVRGMDANELSSLLKSLGLKRVIGSQGLANLIGDEARLRANLQTARENGQQYIACYWPWIGDPGKKIDDWKVVADNLNKGGRICHSEGLQLIYHNHDFEFYPLEGQLPFDVLLPLLDPVVGIELDLYWAAKSGKSPVDFLKKYPGRFPVLHVKDMPADVKCGTGPTNFDLLTEKDFAPIGSGVVDFPAIFKVNAISGAKHFIVEADKPGEDVGKFLELSGKYLREVNF